MVWRYEESLVEEASYGFVEEEPPSPLASTFFTFISLDLLLVVVPNERV